MSRERQRRNCTLKHRRENKTKPWLNHEGYHDPTAYEAIRSLENNRTEGSAISQGDLNVGVKQTRGEV